MCWSIVSTNYLNGSDKAIPPPKRNSEAKWKEKNKKPQQQANNNHIDNYTILLCAQSICNALTFSHFLNSIKIIQCKRIDGFSCCLVAWKASKSHWKFQHVLHCSQAITCSKMHTANWTGSSTRLGRTRSSAINNRSVSGVFNPHSFSDKSNNFEVLLKRVSVKWELKL